jgi:hypothetical protein
VAVKRLLVSVVAVLVTVAAALTWAPAAFADPPSSNGILIVPGTFEGISQTAVAIFRDKDTPSPLPSDFTATITWSDGVIQTGTVVNDINPGEFAVIHPARLFEEGTYSATTFITDVDEGTTFTYTQLNPGFGVQKIDATLSGSGTAVNATAGTPFTGPIGSFTDAFQGAAAPVSDFSATISWGDGHISAGTITAAGNNTFTVTGTNCYATPGPYTITSVINDVGGSTTTTTSTATVAAGTGQCPVASIVIGQPDIILPMGSAPVDFRTITAGSPTPVTIPGSTPAPPATPVTAGARFTG